MTIDIWDLTTFDDELLSTLRSQQDLVKNYLKVDRAHMAEILAGRSAYELPDNPHGYEFQDFQESLIPLMEQRTIRAWHYTRLSDFEINRLREVGVELSTPESLRSRLDAQVSAGHLTIELSNDLYARSRIHTNERRAGTFWLAACPLPVTDGGVEYLLGYWGGEVVNMGLRNEAMSVLTRIGKPSVIEVAIPLGTSTRAYSAAENVVRCFGRTLGCKTESLGFDVFITSALPASAILGIHVEGDPVFEALGSTHPVGFSSEKVD